MAEGWTWHLKGDMIEAYSAGTAPIGVSDRAIKVMAESGVDISMQKSKHVNELMEVDFEYVVTLCDNAAENCPVFPGSAKIIHKPFDDPYYASGSEDEIMAAYRKVRDEIKAFVATLPQGLEDRPEE